MAKKKKNYEEAVKRIDEITEILENDEVSLEQSIELYKEGSELIALCEEKLKEAERQITLLTKKDGIIEETEFEPPEEE